MHTSNCTVLHFPINKQVCLRDADLLNGLARAVQGHTLDLDRWQHLASWSRFDFLWQPIQTRPRLRVPRDHSRA